MSVDRVALTVELKARVRDLEADLSERAAERQDLREEYDAAFAAKRTAATFGSWLDERVTQVAVAWVLGTVFVRFCEDNALVPEPFLAGPDGSRLAVDRQAAFFVAHPERTDRDWILAAFRALAEANPVAAGLFDAAHNPLWQIEPSHEAAKELLAFWRRTDADGALVHDFTDDTWDTRFLGDLYQDLSEAARKTYALLQTPEFVEEFILDLTLDEAVAAFGLKPDDKPLRVIDPTCGSGHFLLGAFHRLLPLWEAKYPGLNTWDRIAAVLSGVHGVDKNPFAVSIARFRLLLAAMRAADAQDLASAPNFTLNIAVGDSLLHGRGATGVQPELPFADPGSFTYSTEDVGDYITACDILRSGSYHCVVGNPPYITVKDLRESENYRKAYPTAHRQYALSVPFAERFFQLAIRGGETQGAGFVGQITANSFMKREFGKKLIQEYLPTINLTHIIDTSGAYIPGHGTPTVILVGRRSWPRPGSTVRAALGVRGEPHQPENPAEGHVWQAIVNQLNKPDSESSWVSVLDLGRDSFAAFPWSMTGGGAVHLKKKLEQAGVRKLRDSIEVTGFGAITGEDDAYFLPDAAARTAHIESHRKAVSGWNLRDFGFSGQTVVLWPYDASYSVARESSIPRIVRFLWVSRRILLARKRFGCEVEKIPGFTWYEFREFYRDRFLSDLTIVFAFVATHNNFVLDRGGKVFNRSAPVIKLPAGAGEDAHLELLGVLNSSAACFWLKQVCHDKGNRGGERSTARYEWEHFYEFTGTKLEEFPLPVALPLALGRELDALAQRLAEVEPAAVCEQGPPTRERLDAARQEHEGIRGRMIALQEELDWEVYRLYGLLDSVEAKELCADPADVPELTLGQRAFEIVLARKVKAGEAETQWFARHGSTPITEIPDHWPAAYKSVVEARIKTIEARARDIGLIERPECKRRWQSEPWRKREKAAIREWLLDKTETRELWFAPDHDGNLMPRPMSVQQLAAKLRDDDEVREAAALYAGPEAGRDVELAHVLAEILADEHVPYLAALRYKDTGLRKRAQWEQVWVMQRQEDATGQRLDIPIPPRYTSADFQAGYWSHRGKLDVPKERFISYLFASTEDQAGDARPKVGRSLLLGWAGWDHREQAHALMTLVEDRSNRDGWADDRLVPLLAGLREVMQWVRQWHGEVDPAYGISPADAYAGYLEQQLVARRLNEEALTNWRPPKPARGRGRAAATPTAKPAQGDGEDGEDGDGGAESG